jgi:hypothetical protein
LIEGLHIGDLSDKATWPTNYVCTVSCFAVREFLFVPSYHCVWSVQTHTYSSKVKWVGLKLYEGIHVDTDTNTIVPTKPWKPDYLFWVHPYYIYDIHKIVEFESTVVGDYVSTGSNNKGIVIKVTRHKRPKFYKTNSLTCKSITVWCTNSEGMTKQKTMRVPRKTSVPVFMIATNHNHKKVT